ncbi:hypothetical protein [Subtercola sp. YIM 133946]|uniref:hypothetical protein n=1 Tax=Subtercola sp. YIM 133946 TaxID=3118909 RepID=UPI002F940E20
MLVVTVLVVTVLVVTVLVVTVLVVTVPVVTVPAAGPGGDDAPRRGSCTIVAVARGSPLPAPVRGKAPP